MVTATFVSEWDLHSHTQHRWGQSRRYGSVHRPRPADGTAPARWLRPAGRRGFILCSKVCRWADSPGGSLPIGWVGPPLDDA